MSVRQIETERLSLRPMAMSDVDQIVDGLNNLNVSRWLTVVPYPYGVSDAQWFITENLEGRATSWSIWLDDAIIGNIGLAGTLGYWLAEPYWCNGYATEAAVAIRDHHFETRPSTSLKSEYFVGNIGSKTVLERLGMRPVGSQNANVAALGTTIQAIQMEMTRKEWETLRTGTQ